MKRIPLFCLAVLLAAQDQTFRMNVQLVSVLATVKNAKGGLVGSLTKDDFTILDEGEPQPIRVFDKQSGIPLVIALLIDSSGSTAKDLKFEKESGSRFIHNIVRPQDSLCIFSFNQTVEQYGGFTSDFTQLETSLKRITSEGGTSLYDAIFLASEQLRQHQGRRVIVLVTDGDDTTSIANYQQALHAAQDADAAIYGVIVVPIPGSVGRNIGGEHALITLAGDTGGRTFQPSAATALDPIFKDLAEELRTQYVLGFYAQPLAKGKTSAARGYRHVEVKTTAPGFTVQARKGYYFREALP